MCICPRLLELDTVSCSSPNAYNFVCATPRWACRCFLMTVLASPPLGTLVCPRSSSTPGLNPCRVLRAPSLCVTTISFTLTPVKQLCARGICQLDQSCSFTATGAISDQAGLKHKLALRQATLQRASPACRPLTASSGGSPFRVRWVTLARRSRRKAMAALPSPDTRPSGCATCV